MYTYNTYNIDNKCNNNNDNDNYDIDNAEEDNDNNDDGDDNDDNENNHDQKTIIIIRLIVFTLIDTKITNHENYSYNKLKTTNSIIILLALLYCKMSVAEDIQASVDAYATNPTLAEQIKQNKQKNQI